jgi:hypothetical protein
MASENSQYKNCIKVYKLIVYAMLIVFSLAILAWHRAMPSFPAPCCPHNRII